MNEGLKDETAPTTQIYQKLLEREKDFKKLSLSQVSSPVPKAHGEIEFVDGLKD